MKKLSVIILALFMMLSVCGCAKVEHSKEAIEAAESAIMYAEQYVNGTMSVEETEKNVSAAEDKLKEYLDKNEDSEYHFKDGILQTQLSILSLTFMSEESKGGRISDIKSQIEELKKEINYKER